MQSGLKVAHYPAASCLPPHGPTRNKFMMNQGSLTGIEVGSTVRELGGMSVQVRGTANLIPSKRRGKASEQKRPVNDGQLQVPDKASEFPSELSEIQSACLQHAFFPAIMALHEQS